MIFLFSCNQIQQGSVMSDREVNWKLSEEIDDIYIEDEVLSSRNETKKHLDIELIIQMGLKELYLHEEALAINLMDKNKNLITLENFKMNESFDENSYFSCQGHNITKALEIEMGNKLIKYCSHQNNDLIIVNSIITCVNSNYKTRLDFFCKENHMEYLNKYSKLVICLD